LARNRLLGFFREKVIFYYNHLTPTQVYGIKLIMDKKQKLTDKQREVLKFIYGAIKVNNLPPTVREIAANFNFSSTGTVRDYLKALVNKGYIRVKANKSRAIELVREAMLSFPILRIFSVWELWRGYVMWWIVV